MKITKSQIKKIIQEEIGNLLDEIAQRPVVKPVPAPKGPVAEPAYYTADPSTRGGKAIMSSDRYQRGYKDTMYREDPRDEQGRVTGMTKSHVPKQWLQRVEKPLEYDPKKHALEENELDEDSTKDWMFPQDRGRRKAEPEAKIRRIPPLHARRGGKPIEVLPGRKWEEGAIGVDKWSAIEELSGDDGDAREGDVIKRIEELRALVAKSIR